MNEILKYCLIGIGVFFAICMMFAMLAGSSATQDCNCDAYERKLVTCQQNAVVAANAWNDYLDAFEDYCDIDYTNPLCLTLPQR